MAEKNGLTLTMVFEAESANYGEGLGNITTLKKMSRADGNMYTYISRQAMRYDIIKQLGWDNTPVDGKSGVVQFAPKANIVDYPEIDLFGYMKTSSKDEKDEKGNATTRSAVARLSNAISLEPYNSDMDYLTNMGLAKRQNLQNAIAQSEIHHSYYSYTITVDLDRVGIDGDINVSDEERSKRVCSLLDTIMYLYRDIKGRRENLAPVFAIGGGFGRKTPYYEGRIVLNKNKLDARRLKEIINSCSDTKENTAVGYLDGSFANDNEVKNSFAPVSISDMFKKVKAEVEKYYA